jgi:hypothetical protein
VATFNGQNIFGTAVVVMGPNINPRRDQKNNFPGLNGTESLDMGDSGCHTTVQGRLYGASLGDISNAILLLLSYYDGRAYTLVTPEGTWPNVKLESVQIESRGERDPNLGYTRRYTARLFHLTIG